MSIFSVINSLKSRLDIYKANKTDESKRRYLRSLGCTIGEGTRFTGRANVGNDPYLVEIGNNCLISADVSFLCHDGGVKVLNSLNYFNGVKMDKMARIRIGDNCFLGCGAVIMGGVSIGNNCIIGTRSVVTKSIPDGMVVAGMPAKVICTIEEYYIKNKDKGLFFPTLDLDGEEKKAYLIENVPRI